MGTFKGGTPRYRSIGENVGALKSSYLFQNGYFGTKDRDAAPREIYQALLLLK